MSAVLLAQSVAAADPLGDLPRFNDLFLRMLAILAGLLIVSVILLKVGLPRLMRRGRRRKAGLIEIVEAHRLEPRKTVYLLRVGTQYYLVGSCDGRLTTLAGEPLDNEAIAGALAERAQPQAMDRPPARTESLDGVARPNP